MKNNHNEEKEYFLQSKNRRKLITSCSLNTSVECNLFEAVTQPHQDKEVHQHRAQVYGVIIEVGILVLVFLVKQSESGYWNILDPPPMSSRL